jgi:hypothetical protein
LAIVALLLIARPTHGQHRLDLTIEEPDVQALGQAGGIAERIGIGLSTTEGAEPGPLPLRITSGWVSHTEWQARSKVVFEVTLTNVGKSPIEVPWAQPKERVHQDPDEQALILTLETVDLDKKRKVLASTILVGVPGSRSLLWLEPSETATIRNVVEMSFDPAEIFTRPDQTTDVRFVFHMRRSGAMTQEVSTKPIVVTVVKKPK